MQKENSKLKFIVIPVLAAAVVLIGFLIGSKFTQVNTVKASENLMDGIKPTKISTDGAVNKKFIGSSADFSVNLFKNTAEKGKNSLVSPLSVGLALGMTENGAENNTLKQFENVLGGSLDTENLNINYYNISNRLKKIEDGKFLIANSIWYRNNFEVKKNFLQKNADYFNAGIFQLDFNKKSTIDKINNWVKENTNGKIDKMVNKIDDTDMMFLINTVYFEDGWLHEYKDTDIKNKDFHAEDTVSVPFMDSYEQYIHDDKSDGMIKPFKDENFAFVAILPKDEDNLDKYIDRMTGGSFVNLINSAGRENAHCLLPKFKYEYEVKLNKPIKEMGITDAFDRDNADFSKMAEVSEGNLYISNVLHKTFIQVDETGAKAGAATEVTMSCSCAPLAKQKELNFDRPFVYAIIDTQTKLPVFIGTVYNPSK